MQFHHFKEIKEILLHIYSQLQEDFSHLNLNLLIKDPKFSEFNIF